MSDSFVSVPHDFAGFIDGLQARNLAAIQRDISLQLSEMQARIPVLKGIASSVDSQPIVFPLIVDMESAFRDQRGNVVDRLVRVGELVVNVLLNGRNVISSNEAFYDQLKGFIRAYVDAADASRNQRLIDSALNVARTYKEAALPVG